MNRLVCLAGFLLVGHALQGAVIIVYAKGESAMVDAIAAPAKPADPREGCVLRGVSAASMTNHDSGHVNFGVVRSMDRGDGCA